MNQANFLIGRGELLTSDIKGPKRKHTKAEVYTLLEAKKTLQPQFKETSYALDELPDSACPHDFGVARLTLNPSYIAKSYFPVALLRSVGLESIGSRNVYITPRKWTKKGQPTESSTTELFVAGKRDVFRHLDKWTDDIEESTDEALDLAHIERFSNIISSERIRDAELAENDFYEVGLHLLPDEQPSFIQIPFTVYAESLGAVVHTKFGFRAGGLWFVPVEVDKKKLNRLSEFSFVRVVRPVPKLRGIRPYMRTTGITVACNLPSEEPLASEPTVAILDGGLPEKHSVTPWLRSYRELDSDANSDPGCVEHGLGVTSAFLFGPIQPSGDAERPYSYVDHLRILDSDTHTEDPLELYRTLGFVEQVLLSRQYEYINLSLGPDLPIEDNDVHAWTSVIDDLLSDGDTFMTIAVGNNGELDEKSGNSRVQVPSDCVNAIAVGASNDTELKWSRASYSAIGPGRSPGVVKPDLMAFGGDASKYFHVLRVSENPQLEPQLGTSFASPYLLRSAVGVRAILGSELTPLAVKALLIHSANPAEHDIQYVGWGKIPEDIYDIITCPSGVARVVYQGELKPSKYLRAKLPLPQGGLKGMVNIKATFCYTCPVDPQDASAYTRAGLDIVFRPNKTKIKSGQKNPNTKSFFSMKKYATEDEQRSDSGKWETVIHDDTRMRGSSLDEPVFDIHYNARDAGGKPNSAEKIRYALIITIEASNHPDLYNEILRSYSNILTPIRPQVSLPVQT